MKYQLFENTKQKKTHQEDKGKDKIRYKNGDIIIDTTKI